MRKGGGDGEDQLGVFGRVLGQKGGRAGIKFQVSKPEGEGTDGLVVVIVPLALSRLSWVPGAIHTDILFAHCPAQPFHHTPNEGQHLFPCSREETDGIFQTGVVPVLIEKDEKLEDSGAGVAWKEKGMAGRQGCGYAIWKQGIRTCILRRLRDGRCLREQRPYLFVGC